MSSPASIALALFLGCGLWMAVRVGAGLSSQPGSGWGLKISQLELVRRGMWVVLVATVSLPVYMGFGNSSPYQHILVPMLAGMAISELAVARWERNKKSRRGSQGKRRRRVRNTQIEE